MRFKRFAAAAALAMLVALGSASADLKIVERTTFDFSKMTIMGNPITPDQLDMIKRSPFIGNVSGSDITMYDAGAKLRCDAPFADSIIDFTAKTDTLLLPATKQYMVTTIPTNQIAQLSAGATASLTDQKQTRTILGHVTHLYAFTITNALLTIAGNMWIATDLPDLGSPAFDSTNPAMGLIVSKVKGFPLQMDAQIDMPMTFGQLGLSYVVSSLSTAPLPASTFAAPADYTRSDTLNPNAFGPLSAPPAPPTPAPAPAAPTT